MPGTTEALAAGMNTLLAHQSCICTHAYDTVLCIYTHAHTHTHTHFFQKRQDKGKTNKTNKIFSLTEKEETEWKLGFSCTLFYEILKLCKSFHVENPVKYQEVSNIGSSEFSTILYYCHISSAH